MYKSFDDFGITLWSGYDRELEDSKVELGYDCYDEIEFIKQLVTNMNFLVMAIEQYYIEERFVDMVD